MLSFEEWVETGLKVRQEQKLYKYDRVVKLCLR